VPTAIVSASTRSERASDASVSLMSLRPRAISSTVVMPAAPRAPAHAPDLHAAGEAGGGRETQSSTCPARRALGALSCCESALWRPRLAALAPRGARTAGHYLGAGLVHAPVGDQLAPRVQRAGRRLLLRDEAVQLGDQQPLARRQVVGGQAVRARLALKVLDEPARLRGPGVWRRRARRVAQRPRTGL
jgi:hypothetical protein